MESWPKLTPGPKLNDCCVSPAGDLSECTSSSIEEEEELEEDRFFFDFFFLSFLDFLSFYDFLSFEDFFSTFFDFFSLDITSSLDSSIVCSLCWTLIMVVDCSTFSVTWLIYFEESTLVGESSSEILLRRRSSFSSTLRFSRLETVMLSSSISD